jgi:hypothetical protein
MSKFDRGVFIFIGLAIWALAMTQVFGPSLVIAHDEDGVHSEMEGHTHTYDEIDDFAIGVMMYESTNHEHSH